MEDSEENMHVDIGVKREYCNSQKQANWTS